MNTNERFINREKIGHGTYGEVYKVKDTKLGKTVALKKIIIQNENEGIPSTTLREISILKNLKHPNIVGLLDFILEPNKIYLIFEYLETDLYNFMEQLPKEIFLESVAVRVS